MKDDRSDFTHGVVCPEREADLHAVSGHLRSAFAAKEVRVTRKGWGAEKNETAVHLGRSTCHGMEISQLGFRNERDRPA